MLERPSYGEKRCRRRDIVAGSAPTEAVLFTEKR